MALPSYTGPWTLKQAAHLLRRATCGVTKAQLDSFKGMDVNSAVNALFPNIPPPAPVLPIDPKTGTEWFLSGTTDANSENADLIRFFHGWVIGQLSATGISATDSAAFAAREKMVWFFHTHFTAITSKISNSRSLYFQNELFRLYSRDGFNADPLFNIKHLTVKISVDNAMLKLLDGDLNVKGAPNENYARELMELYSIGRGVEGLIPGSVGNGDYYYFTEQDVQAAARVLSGWELDEDFLTLDADTNLPRGKVRGSATNASSHDNDPKQFSPRFANTIIQGKAALMNGTDPTEASALDEIQQLIDMIYAKRDTVKNICWKIYRFYVWAPHNLAEDKIADIDANVIEKMADTMIANNYKVLPVIIDLLKSKHFYEETSAVTDNNIGAIIKSPVDLILGTLRFFNIALPDMIAQPTDFYAVTQQIITEIDNQGMNFYEPYDVAGYEAYHQYPVYHRFWITPNYLANRYDFIRNIVTTQDSPLWLDTYNFTLDNFSAEKANATALIAAIAQYLYPIVSDDGSSTITTKRADYFKSRFLNGFADDYWLTNPGEAREFTNALYNAMLQSPEYQLS